MKKIFSVFLVICLFILNELSQAQIPKYKSNTTIVASFWHSFVLDPSGILVGFGYNANGELGNGKTVDSNTPLFVDTSNVAPNAQTGEKIISHISSGEVHSLMISDGLVYAWGRNDLGQLGDGTLIDKLIPALISTEDSLMGGRKIVQVSAGYSHSLALDNKGFIYSWGSNTFGQLGDGTNETRPTPGFVDTTGFLRNKKIVQIFAGYHHNLAIDADGFLYAWGRNDEGQLGDQTFEQRNTPVFCYTEGILKAKTIAAIAAGAAHSMVLFDDGLVAAFGANSYGQLGDGSEINKNVPVLVNFNSTEGIYTKIASISAGSFHSLAADVNGFAHSFGWNKYSQLGNPAISEYSNIPSLVFSADVIYNKKIVSVAAGFDHSMIMDSDGIVYSFGFNQYGQLGLGSSKSEPKPVKITCRPGYTGDDCQTPICNGNCNGNGKCIKPDVCACFTGYLQIENCTIPICFGVFGNETTTVCSNGNGRCVGPDVCECRSGRFGKTCEKHDEIGAGVPFELMLILFVLAGILFVLCVLNLAVMVSILVVVVGVALLLAKKNGWFGARRSGKYGYV